MALKKALPPSDKKMGNGSVVGAGGKSGAGLASTGNSGVHRSDVYRVVGSGKQGRELEVDVAGFVGIQNLPVIGQLKRISSIVIVGYFEGSDSAYRARSGGSAKNP